MGLETNVTYISDFDIAWPLPSDSKSAGDDHIRNLKKALRNCFPLFAGPMNIAHDQVASKDYVNQVAFSAALPAQPGGAVVYDLTTQNGVATWKQRSIFADPDKLAEVYAIALAI